MTDDGSFLLPVTHQGKEYTFPARILQHGYTVKVEVTLEEGTLLFEPDEERNWRAVITYEQLQQPRIKTEAGILEAIAGKLEELTK